MNNLPVIFSVMGDACGIGPELTAKSLKHKAATADVKRLIVGARKVFDEGREVAGVKDDIPTFSDVQEAIACPDPIVFVDYASLEYGDVVYGESTEQAGGADLALARYAVELYRKEMIDGFVFAPVNKVSLKMGGSAFEGYKAYIADQLDLGGSSDEINTLGYLWTTRVTSHVSIADIPALITKESVLGTIRYFDSELRRFGYEQPKIAVSGLNPHNGDDGMFGREEIDIIGPAVVEAKEHGINVEGPFPADTIFLKVKEEEYIGVVSMYHDQCQIATKLMGFDEGVTYFGGLPFPMTTPAHGTAYDIAGKGKASENPLVNALALMRRAVMTAKGLKVS